MGPRFSGDIFHFDQPIVIASNRGSAALNPIVLKYDAGGYLAGTVLARSTATGLYEDYVDGAASGVGTAACILYWPVPVEDFGSATGTQGAVGIFGGCEVFKDKLTGYDAAALVDLNGREFTDGTGVTLIRF